MDFITSENISIFIEQFKNNYNVYHQIFCDLCEEADCVLQIKSKMVVLNERVTDFERDLFEIKVVKLQKEEWLEVNNHNKFLGDLVKFKKELQNKMIDFEQETFLEKAEKSDASVNPHLVHSRQTNNPFIVLTMSPKDQHQCSGCKEAIPLQSLYLKHMEEYPAGSKILKPHSYHIKRKCLLIRGFKDSYLSKIKVFSEKEIDDENKNELKHIGFISKNFQIQDGSDCDSETSETFSQQSETLEDSSSAVMFIYRRKHATQKKKIMCVGCKQFIDSDSYLTRGKTFEYPFHIIMKCIQSDGVVSKDFSRVRCKVFKQLRNHDELKQLLACGLHYKNIIGNKPPNPMNKKDKPFSPSIHSQTIVKPLHQDIQFIFNNESFTCEKLVHGEKCSGCSQQIRKEDLALRHKEKVPRNMTIDTPLISQFYHSNRNCLIDRGFTDKYLGLSMCNVVLSGSDNLSKVRDIVVRCGFFSNNIKFMPTDINTKVNMPDISTNLKKNINKSFDSYLFVAICTKSFAICEGCSFKIPTNQPCFIYGQCLIQDTRSRLFHIKESCLHCHFTKSQLLSMICINNNSMVDVNPYDIVKCGIVNIKTNVPTQSNEANVDGSKYNPFKANLPRFVVDNSADIKGICPACKDSLDLDKYVLRALNYNDGLPSVNMHISATCLRKCGHLPQQLSQCKITLAVNIPPLIRQRLEECGFRNISL